MAEVFKSIGILSRGHLVETDRSGLVAGYTGQTAIKTNQIIDSALGGVLFIDEAYNLAGGNQDQFGMEAINTLLKRLEDDKGKFICIVAGYTKEMKTFLESNSGLPSRFPNELKFPDYSADEMTAIFRSMVNSKNLQLDAEADAIVPEIFREIERNKDKNFANAREVRKFLRKRLCVKAIACRKFLETPDFRNEDLNIITKEDVI
jgi:SpoVK/Ycf46/Vps4 family AAA+-type ATPase